jgi:hypothetical protein
MAFIFHYGGLMMKKFSKLLFRSPRSDCQPGYFWVLDSELRLPELFAQLREMFAHGAESVCLHPLPKEFRRSAVSSMSPPYLSEEYHAVIAAVVEECARLGMNYYLYDEGGWPSGSACGQVWQSDPERFTPQYVIADDNGGVKIIRKKEYPEQGAPYPNLLEPGVTEKFLELTHASCARWFGMHFGKTVRIAFTDEPRVPPPKPGALGWCSDFAEEFSRRKGYDLVPWLPKLLAGASVVVDRLAAVRLDYYDVLSQLFCERYLLPLRNWCRAHGLRSGGHFGGEDQWFDFDRIGLGHILRSLRCLDVPGVDLIWRQLHPGLRLHPFPKLASSVARQSGGDKVLGELFAIYGAGLSLGEMKYLLDFMLFCGVNTFVFSSIAQSAQKEEISGGRPRRFGPVDPLWKYFKAWHQYVGRMSYLFTRGRAYVRTALYFDMRSMWLGGHLAEYSIIRGLEAAWRLQARQVDFDYVDDDALLAASARGEVLRVGKMRYSSLVIPGGSLLAPGVLERLKQFAKGGVRILAPDEISGLPPLLAIEPATDQLKVCRRDFAGKENGYFLFNSANVEIKVRLRFPECAPVAVADAESGKLLATSAVDGELEWSFKPWESRFFISGRAGDTPFPQQPGKTLKRLTKWRLRPLTVHRFENSGFVCEPLERGAVEVELGDWRGVLGDEFSGDALYTTDFRCDTSEAYSFLDLGLVKYACSVRLNGEKLGERAWSPFVFNLSGILRKGKNRLEITVSNTLANALSPEKLLRRWLEKYPESPYENRQRTFEQESLSSGLFGPVCLKTGENEA